MNHRKITKALLFFCIALVMSFAVNLKTFASDYQYKVLDPKYNPYAQDLIDGKLATPADEYIAQIDTPKKFDFAAFFAIAALVLFPALIFSIAIRVFKNFSNITDKETQTIGNIKIEPQENLNEEEDTVVEDSQIPETTEQELLQTVEVKDSTPVETEKKDIAPVTNTITSKVKQEPAQKEIQEETEENEEVKAISSIDETLKKYFTSPVSKIPNPMLLNTSPLTRNKGLCVVEYNKKYSLIGYINEEIFLLDQFESLKNYEIRSRLTETKNSKDRYIVRLGEYKALVEVGESKMSLLLEL